MKGEIDAQAALRLRGIGALETSLVSLDDGSTLGVRPGPDWWEVLAWTPSGVQPPAGIAGETGPLGPGTLVTAAATPDNAAALRQLVPWLRPRPLGDVTSIRRCDVRRAGRPARNGDPGPRGGALRKPRGRAGPGPAVRTRARPHGPDLPRRRRRRDVRRAGVRMARGVWRGRRPPQDDRATRRRARGRLHDDHGRPDRPRSGPPGGRAARRAGSRVRARAVGVARGRPEGLCLAVSRGARPRPAAAPAPARGARCRGRAVRRRGRPGCHHVPAPARRVGRA